MDLRERIGEAVKAAMRAREADRLSTLRLMGAALKDRDIAARGEGQPSPVADDGLLPVLARMAKQRAESARAYDEGARPDLAAKERAEIARQRNDLQRLQIEITHELDRLEKSGATPGSVGGPAGCDDHRRGLGTSVSCSRSRARRGLRCLRSV